MILLTDGRTSHARVIGILFAHLEAFDSGALTRLMLCRNQRCLRLIYSECHEINATLRMEYKSTIINLHYQTKEVRALKSFFASSPLLNFINLLLSIFYNNALSKKSGINLPFTVAMVTKMATKIG